MLAVTVRAARPAIVAAAVLATARALGEAIMISMVSGGRSFSPNPADGRDLPLSSRCARWPRRSSTSTKASAPRRCGSTLYAFALLLLFSAFALSIGGYLIKLPLRKYQVRG